MKNNVRWNTVGRDVLHDVVCACLVAVGTWCFIKPCNVAPGGVNGIALMINYLFGWPVGTVSLLINIPLLIASFLSLNRSMTWKTLRTVLCISIMVDLFAFAGVPQYVGDRLISAAFGGIFNGAGMAVVFMRGSTSGGGDILAKLLQKYRPYMQTGYAIMLIDFAVVGSSVLVYREIEAALYGIITIVCATQTIDMLLYGMNRGSMVTIYSEKSREIAVEVMDKINRGTTFYKSVGGYSGKDCETLVCVVDRKQFYQVKKIVDRHDPKAFVIVSPTKEVYGNGFMKRGWEE